MLVLSRNANEKILIGDDIEVMVVSTKHGSVRLGITAPPHIAVDREEVRRAVQSSGRRRSKDQGDRGSATPG